MHETKLQNIESYIGTTMNGNMVERKMDKKKQQQ